MMRYIFLLIVNTAWALWFGGTIATFVFGWNFFHPTHRSLVGETRSVMDSSTPDATPDAPPPFAGEAASSMFLVFSKYELVLAAVAIVATGLLLVTYPTKSSLGLLAGLIVAGGMAVTVSLGLIPQMESLREQGKQHTEEFKKYHGKSMIATTLQSGVLLLCGAATLLAAKPYREMNHIQTENKSDSEYEPITE